MKLKIVSIVDSHYVDDAIVHYAAEHGCAAATIDRKLKRRLLSNDIVVITVSNNKVRAILPPLKEKI
jgi:rRNA-processing protein FCF1